MLDEDLQAIGGRLSRMGPNSRLGFAGVSCSAGELAQALDDASRYRAVRRALSKDAPAASRLAVPGARDAAVAVIPTSPPPLPPLPLPGSDWRESEDSKELTLLFGEQRLGGVAVWSDIKTGQVSWWTAVIADPSAGIDHDVPGLHNTCDEAKAALVAAVRAMPASS